MKLAKWVLLAAIVLAVIAGIGFLMRPVSYFDGWMYLQEYLSGVQSRWLQVEGDRVHYLAEGPANGPVVVLVHGLGGSAEDWRNLAPYLAHAGFRVYMPDLLGYGRSEKPADFSYSVRDEAAVVIGFMDALGLKQVDLGGWSMGGWIVELVAVEHPERVARLMLFDAAGLNVKPEWDTGLFTPTTADQLDQLDALLMPQPPHVPSYVARDILRLSQKNGWVVKRSLATMMTAQDVTDNLLPRLKMPVLILWGAVDRIVPLNQAETMHRLIPQSELDVFAGCGHLAPLQCTSEMGPKVVKFVEEW
ncbi:MAG: alpha/beta hydrolase [Terracidiphilus sp.]